MARSWVDRRWLSGVGNTQLRGLTVTEGEAFLRSVSETECYVVFAIYKMADGLQMTIFKYNSMKENYCILMPIALKFVAKCPTDNEMSLIPEIAFYGTYGKPLL